MNKLFLTIGILCFLIPIVLQITDKKEQHSLIDTYQKEIETCEDDLLLEVYQKAVEYNKALYELRQASVGQEIVLDYESQLNVTSTGMMGHLEIPKLDVRLPIYHGTSEEVLMVGIGHLEGTSLPVDGDNTHAVLTGHCGLPSAELFTRLDEMAKGDKFMLHSCNQRLTYEVKEIQIVKPDQVEVLSIAEGKNLVSLITCTPYGINTHRLVVTGERIDETEEIVEEIVSEGGVDEKIFYLMGIGTLLFLLLLCGGISRMFGNMGE